MNELPHITIRQGLLLASFILLAAPAQAGETLSVSGTFSDALGGPDMVAYYCGGAYQQPCTDGDPVQARWGEPADVEQSGLGFHGLSGIQVGAAPFLIGTMSYYNFPIYYGTGADEVLLSMSAIVESNGTDVIFDELIAINLEIDETPDESPCPYTSTTPCADRVALAGGVASFTNTIGNVAHTFTIFGFSDSPTGGGAAVDDFISDEGETTTAFMFASFTSEVLIVADAGPDQTVDEGSSAMLDGTGSIGVDLSYEWIQLEGPAVTLDDPSSVTPSFAAPSVPADAYATFMLTVTDGIYSDSDEVTVFIGDVNNPPDCSWAGPSVDYLWPPDESLCNVGIEGVVDPDGDEVTIEIIAVYQDEPVNGRGDGNTSPDACFEDDSAWVRAERNSRGNGRVYSILFTASDGVESCSGVLEVGVPHDMARPPVADAFDYDSTEG